ncbi:hypothetical protein AN189_05275 [Loktanella sp. 3ANDIMAR09]|uniref:Yip1 family protein n=1 Tax=Loktanella sp. 3ANDIMAR09 TaxID=1225657 RepID=UPI0006F92CF5|nr:Yip1 family protein [Loktanella sp. 3ANDIMAR09]KQI69777.1 hypothetical protein AN189_05275 [Loktanella sp. 3ANDIMAR09]
MINADFIKRSLVDPAGTARGLMSYHLAPLTLWSILAVVAICSTILVAVGSMILGSAPDTMAMMPFVVAIVLASSLVVLIFAIYLTGRSLGGQGRLDQTILLVAWWQGIGLVIQLVQTFVMVLLPPLSGIVTLAGFAWLLFALLHFVNVLHGFDSLLKSLGTVALGIIGFSFGIALFLTLIGVGVQGGSI